MTNEGSAAVDEFEQDQHERIAAFVESLRAAGVVVNVDSDGNDVLTSVPFRMQARSAMYSMDWATDDQGAAIANCKTALLACLRVPSKYRNVALALLENTIMSIQRIIEAEGVSDASDDQEERTVSRH